MVMPRSRSMSMESRYCSRMSRGSTALVSSRIRSDRVDLPWSTWLMMEKLRIEVGLQHGPGAYRRSLALRCQAAPTGPARLAPGGAGSTGPAPRAGQRARPPASIVNGPSTAAHDPEQRTPRGKHRSQIKRNRQNERRRLSNKSVRSEMRTRTKTAVGAIDAGAEDTAEATRAAVQADRPGRGPGRHPQEPGRQPQVPADAPGATAGKQGLQRRSSGAGGRTRQRRRRAAPPLRPPADRAQPAEPTHEHLEHRAVGERAAPPDVEIGFGQQRRRLGRCGPGPADGRARGPSGPGRRCACRGARRLRSAEVTPDPSRRSMAW